MTNEPVSQCARSADTAQMRFSRCFYLLSVALLLAGCASRPSGPPTEVQLCKFAYLGDDHTPPTARNIEAFRKITPTMGMKDIVKIVGYPDALWDGVPYMHAYHLRDGSYVTIGFDESNHLYHVKHEDRVYYVKHGDQFIVGMTTEEMAKYGVPRRSGYVSDATTAIRIAEAIWEPLYGEQRVLSQKPFRATFHDNGVWIVRGSHPDVASRAILSAEILERNGRVLRVNYDK